jgi:GntR family transcriptional regulator/MocR family aminotransferase
MSGTWATFGVDLLLELGGKRGREAVATALRDAIRSGRLSPDSALPSSRSLAAELGLARNTVADAYSALTAKGWLSARPGSGTRVAIVSLSLPRGAPSRPRYQGPALRFDLVPGRPDLANFPRAAWLRASRRAFNAAPNDLLGYPDPRGLVGLRTALTEYLGRARGVRTDPDHILICSGFAQGLSLLTATLARTGARTMSVESHGMARHRDLIEHNGLSLRPVDIDESGARTDELTDSDAVLLTAAHQFPLGIPLSSARRAAALSWARRQRAVIVEDDYDGEFRFDRRQVGALQGMSPDLVAYIGTASKSLAPGLSLAWLILPPRLLADVIETKRLTDGYTGVFEQLTLEEFIRSGDYDRHIRRSRLHYRQRREQLVAAMQPTTSRVIGIAAGLHVLLELPDYSAADEIALHSRANRAGIGLETLDGMRFRSDPTARAGLVIGYGTPPDHSYRAALVALRELVG